MSNENKKVAVVTGASRGIGLIFSRLLCQEGFAVHGCSRSANELAMAGYRHHVCDLAKPEEIKQFFRDVKEGSGRLDVLINNAGVAESGLLHFVQPASIEHVFKINVESAVLCSKEAVRLLRNSEHPRIINLSSIHVPLATIGASLYSASKAAVEQLTRSLAKELAPHHITVNCLGLSYVDGTGMNEQSDAKMRETILQNSLYPKLLDESQLGHALRFLIDASADALSGQVIYLGGLGR